MNLAFTFLLISIQANAVPKEEPVTIEDNPSQVDTNSSYQEKNITNPKLETLSHPISEEPPQINDKILLKKENDFFYKYDQSISVRSGIGMDLKEINATQNSEKEYPFHIGIKYMLPSQTYKFLELGLDYNTQPKLYLSALYRFIFFRTERFRPTLGAGLSIRFDEGDKIETPFVLGSYQILIHTGLEYLIKNSRSIRFDLDLHQGERESMVLFLLGHSWGF